MGKKKKQKTTPEDIVSKHSGILGLCAFVNAFPYDVPDFIPDILMVLSDHLHDPQPIPMTIKKTLQDFKRTHQDNWQDHKQKFSDDQLAVLTDLLVSPSYYAWKKEEPLVIFHPGISIKEKLIEILKTLACVTLCCF